MGEVLFLCWHRVQEGVGPVPFAERRRGSGVFRERSMKASDGLSCGAAGGGGGFAKRRPGGVG